MIKDVIALTSPLSFIAGNLRRPSSGLGNLNGDMYVIPFIAFIFRI